MITRCKFHVSEAEISKPQHIENSAGSYRFCFSAVYQQNPGSENHTFWSSSPSGQMKLWLPAAASQEITCGDFFYIDIEPITDDEIKELLEDPTTSSYVVYLKGLSQERYGLGDTSRLGSLRISLGGRFEKIQYETTYAVEFEVSIDNQVVWPMFTAIGTYYKMTLHKTTREGTL